MADYISRKATVIVCDEQYKECLRKSDFCGDAAAWNICDGIKSIPAADVEPVRRGKWNIRLADEMTLCLECSICGRKVDNIDLHNLLEAGEYGEACRRYPYCHCGAKMDLEE